ncbi:MAG: hypothetical protein LBC99_11025 [Spirochaetota bacterium]|jgi:hypothetical protein|nr:hypothetical protein [Spirochaetota bacterium]
MKQNKLFHSKAVVVALAFFMAAACGLGEPSSGAAYSSVRYRGDVSAAACLADAVSSARTSIKLALNKFVGTELIEVLNDKADSGVAVDVVYSAANAGTIGGLSGEVGKRAGNTGNMQSNFAIIDDDTVVFFSDCALSEPATIAITIRQADLIQTLNKEFSQMFKDGLFGTAKQNLINTQIVFPSVSGDIDMYLLPRQVNSGAYRNDVIAYICTRVRQARASVDVYAGAYNNAVLNTTFTLVKNNGPAPYFCSGYMATPPNPNFVDDMLANGKSLSCNIIIIDAGTSDAVLIFTTFPFAAAATMNASDGVALFIRGETVEQIKASLDATVSALL